ncbi:TlpA family protein disulfide reductase [Brevibacterium ihuae]|uniref:TlpA family protein disulfide reductase n=1 Tax=Brevibacterium ihuae TaxID=1631743 RepID=UPI000C773C91|nr:TlpA disulfide reductase family protein [Brevibacterium ihuae]
MTSRRQLLAWAAAAVAGTAIAGCSPESDALAEQAGSEQGYISGTGVITQVPAGERGAPLELDFELLDGSAASLAGWRPRAVVINLWYAACPPCRKEAPDLVSAAEAFADDTVFLGVNVRDQAAAAQAFVESFSVPYPNMLDTDGTMVAALSSILPPQATPSTVILDREGRPAARVVGAVEESTLRGLIEDVLAE